MERRIDKEKKLLLTFISLRAEFNTVDRRIIWKY